MVPLSLEINKFTQIFLFYLAVCLFIVRIFDEIRKIQSCLRDLVTHGR